MNSYLTFGGVENLLPGVQGVQSRTLPDRFTKMLTGMRSPSSVAAGNKPPGGIGDNAGRYTPTLTGATMGDDQADGMGGNPLTVWVGFAILLVILHFVRRSQESLQQNLLGLNVFNLLVITITAILGITLFKVVFAKVPVPGVSQLVHAA